MPGYRNTDGRGRKPATNVLRYVSANQNKRNLRFILSEDMVDQIMGISGAGRLTWANFRGLYFQIERFPWVAPHACLLRIALLGKGDPDSWHIRKSPSSPRWQVEIPAHKVEMKRNAPGHTFTDIHWDTQRRGLMIQFPLKDMTDEARERWSRIERHRKLKEAVEG